MKRGVEEIQTVHGLSERGATLVEVLVAASILAITATVATQTASNLATLEGIDEGQKATLAATSRVDAETRSIMKDSWKNDLCLASGSLQSKLVNRATSLGDRQLTIRPLANAASYVGVTGGGVPPQWASAIAACNSPADRDACLEIVLEKDGNKISQGFVVLRLVPWNFNTGSAPATCASSLETEPGMGYRLNNAVFLETKLAGGTIHRTQRAYLSLFANAIDGEGLVPPVMAPPVGLQGPSMIWGWRSKWPLPPEPGAAYTAWAIPYKKIGTNPNAWAVPVACTSFDPLAPSAACTPYSYLNWMCDGTLFSGVSCKVHPWFK